MRIPHADRAEVDIRKLSSYCLSPTHPVGKHKAAVFRSALGLTVGDAIVLQGWLKRGVTTDFATIGPSDEHGDRYQVDFEAATPTGRATIRSAWIIRRGEDFPRLTTCYVLTK